MTRSIEKRLVTPTTRGDDYREAWKGEERRGWLEARTLIVDHFATRKEKMGGSFPVELEVLGPREVEILTSLFVVYQIKDNGGHSQARLEDFLQFCKVTGLLATP